MILRWTSTRFESSMESETRRLKTTDLWALNIYTCLKYALQGVLKDFVKKGGADWLQATVLIHNPTCRLVFFQKRPWVNYKFNIGRFHIFTMLTDRLQRTLFRNLVHWSMIFNWSLCDKVFLTKFIVGDHWALWIILDDTGKYKLTIKIIKSNFCELHVHI